MIHKDSKNTTVTSFTTTNIYTALEERSEELGQSQQRQCLAIRHRGDWDIPISLQLLKHRRPEACLLQLALVRYTIEYAPYRLVRPFDVLVAHDDAQPEGLEYSIRKSCARARFQIRRGLVQERMPKARLTVLIL